MLTEKLFGVISLGCDKNRVDTEKMLGLIKSHGYNTTDDLNKAQIVIINTCAFLQSARKEAIDTIQATGRVEVNGMEWSAKTEEAEMIEANAIVIIKGIQGVKLIVEKEEV